MKLAIVGTGYVGLVTGACLANTGNRVRCLDIDAAKVEALAAGKLPIYEPGLEELVSRNAAAGRLAFTTDADAAYAGAEVIFICVGTPSDAHGRADLRYVFEAADAIAARIEAAGAGGGAEGPIVVVKSTVPVGTNAQVEARIAAATGRPFRMASNPEFLKEGAAIADFQKPDRVVIGVRAASAGERLTALYAPFVRQGNPIQVMDVASAEMVKYASNAMLATKISFINEIANLCEAYGADVDQVRLGMCADRRIGNQFLYPGIGYGGSCFPKDVLACLAMGEATGTPTSILRAVDEVNRRQRSGFLEKIQAHFEPAGGLGGRRVALWGLAFKPGTDDIREAPAVTIAERLVEAGAELTIFDPVARAAGEARFGAGVRFVDDAFEALEGCEALVIATDWDQFKHPDLEAMRARMARPVIFDGRNLYAPSVMREAGFHYESVGRLPVTGVGP